MAFSDSIPKKSRRAFEALVDETFSLKLCNEDADCVDTYYSSPMCPATCTGCELAVNRRHISKFNSLKAKAKTLGEYPCPPVECASVMKSCQIRCISNICEGKMYVSESD